MPEQDINSTYTDGLSPLTQRILAVNLENAYARLVAGGPGSGEAGKLLASATPTELLTVPVADEEAARAMLSGLWLWHDWLEESHHISQSLPTATGSFWHAIMHRREGDFSNSKYWLARCEGHPAIATLAQQAAALLNPLPADKALLRLTRGGWDPDAFVDLVEQVHDRPADARHAIAISLQQLEWRVLFDHCARAATGR